MSARGVGFDAQGRPWWFCDVCGKHRTQGATKEAAKRLLEAHEDSPIHRLAARRARRGLRPYAVVRPGGSG